MNKVVCNICGTSYPENAAQCPICGYAQNSEKAASANSQNNSYTYVKGGRFSKENVKKRNQAKAVNTAAGKSHRNQKREKKSKAGSIIIPILLTLIVLAVIAYFVQCFFLPDGLRSIFPSAGQATEAPTTVPPVTETEAATISMACTSLKLDAAEVQIEGIGSTYTLTVSVEPVGTPDPVTFSTSDDSVAAVSETGVITAKGEGTAVITVTCGSESAQCAVTCTVPNAAEVLTLNRKEITFNTEGQSWVLYDGTIPTDEIVWSSDDNKVATIADGKVVAVGTGDTTVSGSYNGQMVQCAIHCRFDEETQSGNSGISEAIGESGNTYQLYNPYGFAEDVTINSGDQFILKLVDQDMNEAANVQWTVDDEDVCSFNNNVVEGKNPGTTTVTATCEGKTYTCIVRVN